MQKIIWLIAIPIAIGIITGASLALLHSETDSGSSITAIKLINSGSPILGNVDAPITIVEWGDYQCTFCYKFSKYVKYNQRRFYRYRQSKNDVQRLSAKRP